MVNEQTGELKRYEVDDLEPGHYFTIGVSDKWLWQPGEKIYVTYKGNTRYWKYNMAPASTITNQKRTCTRCYGTGKETCYRCTNGVTPLGESCPSCYGVGKKSCSYCNGLGYR